jgi:hypothetical protein
LQKIEKIVSFETGLKYAIQKKIFFWIQPCNCIGGHILLYSIVSNSKKFSFGYNQICFGTGLTSKYTLEEPRVLKHEEPVPKPYWRFY